LSLTMEAVYENGVFIPSSPPLIEEHKKVRLTVEESKLRSDPRTPLFRITDPKTAKFVKQIIDAPGEEMYED